MKRFRKHGALFPLALLAGLGLVGGDSLAAEKMRITLDTNPTHVRNKTIALFVDELNRRAEGKLEIEVYPSAQLFRDRDVAKALRQGSVEMAAPGTWQLDGLEPTTAISSLPVFYGLSEEVTLRLMDGKLGQAINKHVEERLRVKVIGPWINLGFSHFYSVAKPLQKHEDLAGLKIRVSGGTANSERMLKLGGTPTVIPWPDVPLALSSATVDAIQSTHESVASAKLWESGLKYAFEDRQWFGQYVPMISQAFWSKLAPDTQKAVLESWAAVIGEGRKLAAKAQLDARAEMERHGMTIVTASDEALRQWREKLMTVQDNIVRTMKIDPDLVQLAVAEVQKASDAPK
jgi:C4-dicarboxylate-binding protein DctP